MGLLKQTISSFIASASNVCKLGLARVTMRYPLKTLIDKRYISQHGCSRDLQAI